MIRSFQKHGDVAVGFDGSLQPGQLPGMLRALEPGPQSGQDLQKYLPLQVSITTTVYNEDTKCNH